MYVKAKKHKNLELSGLGNLIKKYTFNAYETSKPWQSEIKKKALLFTQNSGDSWFYAAGQPGRGKHTYTHTYMYWVISTGRLVKYKSLAQFVSRVTK